MLTAKHEPSHKRVLVESGIAQRQRYLEAHLPKETRDTIPAEFYTYEGFRDWWQMPLVFPYQLMCIDTRDQAYLGKYVSKYPVPDLNESTSGVPGDLTRIATDNAILLFERRIDAGASYGMLQYESRTQSECETLEHLWTAAQSAGYSGPTTPISIEDMFTAYYNYEKEFVDQSPGGDSLKAAPPK